jgi:hypothetical protein
MTRRTVFFSFIGSGIICLALAGISNATVPRAFVSINGSDLGPCSAVQPCRSFNAALAVVQAGGEIVVQDSGGYSTGFTITQSVTIDAAGFNASVISTGGTDLCTINAGPSDRVVLRGISFHGANVGTNAINVTQVGTLYVEHCSISEFTSEGVNMPNGGDLFVTNTDVRACSDGLAVVLHGATPANLVAQDSRFTQCKIAGVELLVFGAASATGWLSNCTVSLCGGEGVFAKSFSAASVDLTLSNCRILGNFIGLDDENSSTGNATMRVSNCVVTRNGTGLNILSAGGGVAAILGTGAGTNLISGNFASNVITSGSVALQ